MAVALGVLAAAQDLPSTAAASSAEGEEATFDGVAEPDLTGIEELPPASEESPAESGRASAQAPGWGDYPHLKFGAAAEEPPRTESQARQAPPTEEPIGFPNVLRAFAWLAAICGFIVLAGYAVRRFGKNTPLLAGQRYGAVLGKVHLTPRASLHYVRSGGRVLVVGITANQMTLITEFDAAAFEDDEDDQNDAQTSESAAASSFLDELRARTAPPEPAEDDDLAMLRGDVRRLQHYLEENLREPLD